MTTRRRSTRIRDPRGRVATVGFGIAYVPRPDLRAQNPTARSPAAIESLPGAAAQSTDAAQLEIAPLRGLRGTFDVTLLLGPSENPA